MDKDLCELFFGVMGEHLTDLASIESVKRVKRTLPEIRKKYKGDRLKRESVVRSFPSVKSRGSESQMENIAYFYECCTCLASSTATNFSEVLKGNEDFYRRKMQRKTVNICCMAGGMASEMAAVVKVLCHSRKDWAQEFLHFHLTFISAGVKWKPVIQSVLRGLNADVIREHRIKLTSCFVPAQNDQGVLEALHSADILISTKLSQEMSDMGEKSFKQLFEVAFLHLKPDSLVFFIDTSAASFINFLAKTISKFNCFQTVYRKSCDYHSLSLDSIELHLKRYSDYFGVDLNASYCFFSACAWRKFEKRRGSKSEDTSNASPSRMKKDKKAARKDAYWFRRSVDILFSHADRQ